MGRWLLALSVLLTLVASALAADPPAPSAPPAPLPKRARLLESGAYASPMGFRDTVEWYRKEFRRRGVQAEFTPVRRWRDVVFVRILPRESGLAWGAVHILLAEGRTSIYLLAAFDARSAGGREGDLKAE